MRLQKRFPQRHRPSFKAREATRVHRNSAAVPLGSGCEKFQAEPSIRHFPHSRRKMLLRGRKAHINQGQVACVFYWIFFWQAKAGEPALRFHPSRAPPTSTCLSVYKTASFCFSWHRKLVIRIDPNGFLPINSTSKPVRRLAPQSIIKIGII